MVSSHFWRQNEQKAIGMMVKRFILSAFIPLLLSWFQQGKPSVGATHATSQRLSSTASRDLRNAASIPKNRSALVAFLFSVRFSRKNQRSKHRHRFAQIPLHVVPRGTLTEEIMFHVEHFHISTGNRLLQTQGSWAKVELLSFSQTPSWDA